ncbi:BgTH12-00229 [Blumeria graminis f. sp. triticale]|uniref:BgTH12-00229 n=1 Tax=Blumeria graminis f. sp. triticale TaxID=1689686 RepID=A0A9W4D624_BLUGR|nr:BgTH12-00229 [Blumeria graminis f. sp. triticale]
MSYIAPIHRPSSVRHAVKLNLFAANESCLVVAKANRIEIWEPSEVGLSMKLSKSFYGRISMLAKIRPLGSTTDHLFIGTLRFKYFTIAWNKCRKELETILSFEDISDRYMRESQSRDGCLVDPTHQYMILELFEGVINLIRIIKPKRGKGQYMDKAEQVRLAELKVRSSTFLYTETKQPKIAILYTDRNGSDVRLATYRIVDEKGQYSSFNPKKDRDNELAGLDITASHLIPVPKGDRGQKRYMVRSSTISKALLGGVIIVGETTMTYLDDESKAVVNYILDEASIFVAWEQLDGLNYLLADAYTRLFVLTIVVDGPEVLCMKMRFLGNTSKASQMVLLDENLVFIASHEGDSQVIAIDLSLDKNAITLIQTMPNIAPILDFAIMNMGCGDNEPQWNEYSFGQAQLITGSGANECGSLRSVRSGVGLEDDGILADIQEVISIFALKSTQDSESNDILLVSLPMETRIFKFSSAEDIEEVEQLGDLIFCEGSLLAMSLPNGRILQITTSLVMILGSDFKLKAKWSPLRGQRISAASSNHEHVLLSSDGVSLISLDINQNLHQVATQILDKNEQVACVHVPIQFSGIGVVGFWQTASVSIIRLPTIETIQTETLRKINGASTPRSLALAQVLPTNISGPSLFIAMEDGVIITFTVDPNTFNLSGKKSVVLGSQQAQFHILPQKNGLINIFTTCEHPSLIYSLNGHIVYSIVTAYDITSVCHFDSDIYPDSVVVATPTTLKISKIDTQRRTHIRSLPVGVTVRRVAYSSRERVFGIGCVKRELIHDQEVVSCSFALVEDILFNRVGEEYKLNRKEEVIECVVRTELPTEHSDCAFAERFIIGTSFLDNDGGDERGRILVLSIDGSRSPSLVSALTVKGACRQVAILNGHIVAALVKTVVIYKYVETTSASAEFFKLATYRCSTCPIDLVIHDNIIAVADLQKSLALLEYQPGQDGLPDKLVEVARHYQSCWATAVSHIEGYSYLESDQEGNLIVLRRNTEELPLKDQRRMEVTGEFHLGEMVNRIRKIRVRPTADAVIIPQAFLATTEGSIYLFSTISPSAQDLLLRLQSAIAAHVKLLGDIDFQSYRSFWNLDRETLEPFRFVDGELIERFLEVDKSIQADICRGLGSSVEGIRGMVEDLKHLH